MKKKEAWQQWAFSAKERAGMIVLAVLILLLLVLPEIIQRRYPADQIRLSIVDTMFSVSENKRAGTGYNGQASHPFKEEPFRKGALFFFDPNTLADEGWVKLGLPSKRIKTIRRFIEKGGRFRVPADIRRIYGLSPQLLDQLEPFVRIERSPAAIADSTYHRPSLSNKNSPPSRPPLVIDINAADSSLWESLPGIGAKLSSRIVQFRQKLGGFYGIAQLKEVYGIPDSTFQKIEPYLRFSGGYSRLDINAASQEQLAAHPYIKWRGARIISAWKKEHGAFLNSEQLWLTGALDSAGMRKLIPYLILGK